VEALERLDLEGLRAVWRERFGTRSRLRSPELLRLMIAWRLQADVLGGFDHQTRRRLRGRGRVLTEGLELGLGARLSRVWQGKQIEVVVEASGFRWEDRSYPSLSAVATAIAGSRWNGPRFFGLRSTRR
jgi:hypothetical protein